MSRDWKFYLNDISVSCEKIMRFTEGQSLEQLIQDEKTYDAVVRNLEIIGEAAKNIPSQVRSSLPNIDWRKAAGMRDMLAHVYFGIDNDVLWDVVRNKVPRIAKEVEAFLNKE